MPLATPPGFRPATLADLPLLTRWLHAPHVSAWWGDPVVSVQRIERRIADPLIDTHVFSAKNTPIGYLQCYEPHTQPADHPYRDQPLGTHGIDMFIGEPGFIGRGHGGAAPRTFVDHLFAAGATRALIDPSPDNPAAIAAYRTAGFHVLGPRDSVYGHLLMMIRDARDA